jgi:hypothetical protein
MVGEEDFLETQGPENLQNWSQWGQRTSLGIACIAAGQPMSEVGENVAQEGGCRLGNIEAVSPTAERGRIGHAIRVFERGCGRFPGAVLFEAPPQGLSASQQAVARVRERERWQEGEGFPATGATTAMDSDPIMVFIMRLLAAASMADDRVAFTLGASPQDDLVAAFGPIRFELVRRGRKWDKENRSSWGLCLGSDLPRSQPEAGPLLLKRKSQLEENNAARLRNLVAWLRGLAG